MARFQCRACGFDGEAPWDGRLVCPRCGSDADVRAAYAVEEMTEEDVAAILAAMPPQEEPSPAEGLTPKDRPTG